MHISTTIQSGGLLDYILGILEKTALEGVMETSKKGVAVFVETETSHCLNKRISEVNKKLASTKDSGIR